MPDWVKQNRLKMCVIFEARDAAGKGGMIKRITDPLNPRVCRVVALGTPTGRERGQWYFQRYVAELPAAGEIVLFDRSWYNRAGAERVMGFCTDDDEQDVSIQGRMRNPIKRCKLSSMDIESRRHWVDYSRAKDIMFAKADTK